MSAAAAPESKQAAQAVLAKSVSDKVLADLVPLLNQASQASAEQSAEIQVQLATILARLEVLEMSASSAKKATKVGGKGAAAKAGGKGAAGKKAGEDPRDKVKNSMLYFRWAMANDEEFYNTYMTDEIREALEADENLAKKKDPTERKLAEGTLLWKSHLSVDQKADIRTLFTDWQAQREKASMEEQLDDGAEADTNGAAAAEDA